MEGVGLGFQVQNIACSLSGGDKWKGKKKKKLAIILMSYTEGNEIEIY